MADRRVVLLKVLKAELEDLLEDIKIVDRRAVERYARREITDYVYKENQGLLHLESESILNLIAVIDSTDPTLYKTLDDLAALLDRKVKELVRDHEDPEAVYRFFVRKLNKVLTYVEGGD